MRSPRTWVAIIRIIFNKLCCWCCEEKPVDWQPARAICLGIDGAGKTSLCSCIEGKAAVDHEPTSGFNCRNARLQPNWLLDLWDLGGSELIRQYWTRYLTSDTQLIIFVVDAAAPERFEEARDALNHLLLPAARTPILVVANKQDLAGAVGTQELADVLELQTVRQSRRCDVLAMSCAKSALKPDASMPELKAIRDWVVAELERQWDATSDRA